MIVPADQQLYARGVETLLATWAAYAHGARDAALVREAGVAVAVFPYGPERAVYNNAVPSVGLEAAGRTDAIDAVETAYAAAGVDRYAVWAHETDAPLLDGLRDRGYAFDTATRAMAMDLEGLRAPRPEPDLPPAAWPDHLAHLAAAGFPDGLLAGVDPGVFHVVAVERDGERAAATAFSLEHEGDCGIYNVSTAPAARRRGLGTAVTAALVHAARDRGCTTASLQSTPMAESLYARLGFRDLGRFLEFVPPAV